MKKPLVVDVSNLGWDYFGAVSDYVDVPALAPADSDYDFATVSALDSVADFATVTAAQTDPPSDRNAERPANTAVNTTPRMMERRGPCSIHLQHNDYLR